MDHVTADIASAPLASARTLRHRKNMAVQIGRFVALNVRFVTMIFKGEH
jgi:hypothetical protein